MARSKAVTNPWAWYVSAMKGLVDTVDQFVELGIQPDDGSVDDIVAITGKLVGVMERVGDGSDDSGSSSSSAA